jgi:hypothetical protein
MKWLPPSKRQQGSGKLEMPLLEPYLKTCLKPEPPKVETIKLQVIEDATWLKDGVQSTLISHIADMKDKLIQTVDTIPGLYRDFSAMHKLLANDIDMLQTQVDLVSKSQKASRQETLVMTDVPLVNTNFQTAINLLAAELERVSIIANDAAQVTVKVSVLQAKVNKLEGQLNLTLQAVMDLKQALAAPKPRVEFESTKMVSLDNDRLLLSSNKLGSSLLRIKSLERSLFSRI